MLNRLLGRLNQPRSRAMPLGREFHMGDVIEQRYEIEHVRRGFMGIVYIAYDRHRRRKVVLKTFQNKFLWDDAAIARFYTEAELWMRLGGHPNIVRAYDLRTFMGKPHVVAEYIHGGPLRALIGHLSEQEALDYAIQICWGMRYASERAGVIHGDLKPDNILVTLSGEAKVTDFGLARVMPIWQWSDDLRQARMPLRSQAVASDVLGGTLPYMAPELLEHSINVGPWSDVYAFGVMLFEMLTGRLPFDSNRDESLIRMHLQRPTPDPRQLKPSIPVNFVEVVLSCLAKRQSERYQGFAEIEQDLQQVRQQLLGEPLISADSYAGEESAERWIERGLAHMDLGEHREALNSFVEALRYDSEQLEAWLNLARARLKLWQYTEALRAVDEGLQRAESRNTFGQLYQIRGEVYASMLRLRDAVVAFDQGLSYTPNAPGLWREKGALLLRLGMAREAVTCLEKALRFDPFDPLAWRLMGDARTATSAHRRAYRAYSEALQLDPRSALGWARYGQCQLRLARRNEAIRSFEMALRLDPDLQDALDGLRQARSATR